MLFDEAPTDTISCTSTLLLLTANLLIVFMFVLSVYSMFYHDGVCLSRASAMKGLLNCLVTYLPVYYTGAGVDLSGLLC